MTVIEVLLRLQGKTLKDGRGIVNDWEVGLYSNENVPNKYET